MRMARVTVEDCIDKVDSPYELVLVAKERATQLNSGIEPSLERTPILPSKRARKIPEKIQVSKEDLDELKNTSEPEISNVGDEEDQDESDISLDEMTDKEKSSEENI